MMKSGLACIDDIICTEEIDILLPRIASYINERRSIEVSTRGTSWTTRQNITLRLPPINLTSDANTIHARPSSGALPLDYMSNDSTLIVRDVLLYLYGLTRGLFSSGGGEVRKKAKALTEMSDNKFLERSRAARVLRGFERLDRIITLELRV